MSTVQQPMRPHDAARATVRAVPTRMCRVVEQLPRPAYVRILYTRWPGLACCCALSVTFFLFGRAPARSFTCM